MVHSFLSAIITFFSLTIIRNSDAFSNYPIRIEILSITFSVSTLSPAKTIDKFFAVLSASAKSLL
jgi:hypothetical protein